MNRPYRKRIQKQSIQRVTNILSHLIKNIYDTLDEEEEGYETRKTLLKKARTDMDSIVYDIEKKILSLEKETK